MKRPARLLLWGVGLGAIIFKSWRWYQGSTRIRNLRVSTQDLNYSDRSPEDLVSEHLIDLNAASAGQLDKLGVSAESLERLVENRPYRNKLELVSRLVLSEDEYSAIKDRVSVALAREPVKIA